jgi:hypothetical protein
VLPRNEVKGTLGALRRQAVVRSNDDWAAPLGFTLCWNIGRDNGRCMAPNAIAVSDCGVRLQWAA